MIEYIMDLTLLIAKKSATGTIQEGCEEIIDRLIENKVVMEKSRILDKKLKYYTDKLIKIANSNQIRNTNRSTLKANPDNFADDGTDVQLEPMTSKNGFSNKSDKLLYVPPKISAVHYSEGREMQAEDKKRVSLSAAIRQDLIEEYLDEPLEITHTNRLKQVLSKHEKERVEFEESYMTRLPETRADKAKKRKLMTIGSIADELVMDSVGMPAKKRKIKSNRRKK